MSSGVVSHSNQNETSPSLGAANCASDATFVGALEVHWSSVPRRSELDLAFCAGLRFALSPSVGSWEVQRSGSHADPD
eukprot:7394581-Pyramimonas_sp.AAC.1